MLFYHQATCSFSHIYHGLPPEILNLIIQVVGGIGRGISYCTPVYSLTKYLLFMILIDKNMIYKRLK